jgi:hypothetical protein
MVDGQTPIPFKEQFIFTLTPKICQEKFHARKLACYQKRQHNPMRKKI